MKKLALVVDSSAGFTPEEITQLPNVFVAPLSIIYKGKEYTDQVDISIEEVQDILSRNELIQTSQPSVGTVHALYEDIQSQGYDHIIVVSLSSKLSGTFNSFSAAADALDNNNVSVIDTMTIAGPVQASAAIIEKLNQAGKSVDEIVETLNTFYKHTESYVIPETLDQLKASGRISAAAGAVASLLKMKVLLKLDNHGETIEKFAMGRTESKLMRAMYEDIEKNGFNPSTDQFHLLHSLNEEKVLAIKDYLQEKYNNIKVNISYLPAALSGHAGNGTIVLQWFMNPQNVQ